MPVREPWFEGETPEERKERREAYERIAKSASRLGLPLERLAALLRQLAANEAETRRFLSEIYHVPDDSLDDYLRLRMKDLELE
jgi:rubrerythrin